MIVTRNLDKTFFLGKTNEMQALRGIDLSIGEGECVVLQGASGSGKSTLLSILACLSKPTSGEYECMGENVGRWSEKFLTRFRQAHFGIVFQHFYLLKGADVFTNIALPLIPRQISDTDLKKSVVEAAQSVGLAHKLDSRSDLLSGGEMQRVALARALVAKPNVLFADEPTAHLDSENTQKIMEIFSILKAKGKTIVITTHDLRVSQHAIIDRQITLQYGKIINALS